MNKQQLASKIWESANKMRSKIEANEYKDYILGFIFYKFLSETEINRLKARDFAERICRASWKTTKKRSSSSRASAATSSPTITSSPPGSPKAVTSRFRTFAMPSLLLAATSTLPASASLTASSTRCRPASPSSAPTHGASPRRSRPHLPHQGHPDGRSPGL